MTAVANMLTVKSPAQLAYSGCPFKVIPIIFERADRRCMMVDCAFP
jgi:hypothetical protein